MPNDNEFKKMTGPQFGEWLKQNKYAGYTPTASQEALQEPAFDPVMLLAGGLAGGLDNILGERAWQALLNDMPKSMPFQDAAQSLFREIPNKSMARLFGEGVFDAIQGGSKVQALNSLLFPQHPMAGKIGALPFGQEPTGILSRYLQFALDRAKTIPEP